MASSTDIFPEAIGLFLVLETFLSNSLSTISFIIQTADLIKTEHKKKKDISKDFLKVCFLFFGLWSSNWGIWDLKFGFYANNCP